MTRPHRLKRLNYSWLDALLLLLLLLLLPWLLPFLVRAVGDLLRRRGGG